MTPPEDLPPEFIALLKSVQGKRARTVINHLLEHGQITSDELKDIYGYKHPPRAVRDVREEGIPIETFRITSSDGRSIAAYRFGDVAKIRKGQLGGRRTFPKAFKEILLKVQEMRCAVCNARYEARYLQIDHRVPYEVVGDTAEKHNPVDYMLLCPSCNRAKSWSCEHCENWRSQKKPEICELCYWANPLEYDHIAMTKERRVDLVWEGNEIDEFEIIKLVAETAGVSIQTYIKNLIHQRRGNT